MGNLISLFSLSMLTTEPETNNHGEVTFLEEHNYTIQVQQTAPLMPVLSSTSLLGQKILNLAHNVPGQYCFQSQAARCWEANTCYTPLVSKNSSLASSSSPETEQVQPCALEPATPRPPSCHRSNPGHRAEQQQSSSETQLGAFGDYCRCTFQSTHITGALCLSLLFTHRNRNCYWNTTSSKGLQASSYHRDLWLALVSHQPGWQGLVH